MENRETHNAKGRTRSEPSIMTVTAGEIHDLIKPPKMKVGTTRVFIIFNNPYVNIF